MSGSKFGRRFRCRENHTWRDYRRSTTVRDLWTLQDRPVKLRLLKTGADQRQGST
jgi:hypothetical protein